MMNPVALSGGLVPAPPDRGQAIISQRSIQAQPGHAAVGKDVQPHVGGWLTVDPEAVRVSGSSLTLGSKSRQALSSASEPPAGSPSSVCSEAKSGWLPRYHDVSISARRTTPRPARRTTSHS